MAENRLKTILKTSIIAILVNVALGAFKAFVGLISNSIAITMDAINNFTDAGSSLITIVSAHFASKDADKKHPFGYGRVEYLGTLLIAGLILYAGFTSLIESVKKIINPETAEYSTVSLVILAVAVLAKSVLAIYMSKVGKRVNSDSLIASGKEAIGDIAISIATILAALLFIFTGFAVEAYLGAIIAALIIKAGIETLREIIGKILGTGAEVQLVKDIKKTIVEHEQVKGAYDLVLHNYGPDSYMASVHIEVEDTLSIGQFDDISREIRNEVLDKFGVFLTSIGLYSVNTQDEEVIRVREDIRKIALANSFVHQMHGFYINLETKIMRFDLVISFDAKDRREVFNQVLADIREKYPDYNLNAGMDCDFNEV